MALFITLGLISRPSAKMLSQAQHPDYAQHLSVYAVSCTVQVALWSLSRGFKCEMLTDNRLQTRPKVLFAFGHVIKTEQYCLTR